MTDEPPGDLTHIDARGRAVMVDVTGKASTHRVAVVSGQITGLPDAFGFVASLPDLLTEARIAGLRGAKATSTLIPLCHPLPLDGITIDFRVDAHVVTVVATAETIGQTGVEMEALCACGIAALVILGRARPVAPDAAIDALGLEEKRGGKSGTWHRYTSTTPSEPPSGQ